MTACDGEMLARLAVWIVAEMGRGMEFVGKDR